MNNYLLTLGWWNLVGSLFMLTFFNPEFGNKVLVEWTRIFKIKYEPGYWGHFWLGWTIGLNLFFALVNIFASQCHVIELKQLCVYFDLFAYLLFVGLTIWGIKTNKCGSGIYSVFIIFGGWIVWGITTLIT